MPLPPNVNISFGQQSKDPLEELLERQQDLQAQIESLLSLRAPPSTRSTRSPIRKNRNSLNVPRNHSFNTSSLSRQLSDQGPEHGRMRRTGSDNASRQSAPGMCQTRSNLSSSSSFSNTLSVPHFSCMQQEAPALTNWTARGDDPVTEYTFAQVPTQVGFSSPKPSVGEDIDNYLSRTSGPLNTIHVQNIQFSGQNCVDQPVSAQQFGLRSPVSLYDEALTNDSSLSSDMSRQSSFSDEALMNGFKMIHVDSAASSFTDVHDAAFSKTGHQTCSREEHHQLLLGTGGVAPSSLYSPIIARDSDGAATHLESMQRSSSNDSTSSISSSRSKLQLQRQIQLANARPLAAKPLLGDMEMSREPSSQSISGVPFEPGHDEKRAQAIPKAVYQRPLHPKVWCKQCDEYPDGFRGEHELRRHTDRQHKVIVKKWICTEPKDGLAGVDHPVPINPLSKCKACSQLKKKYGAYYNAAAHLRRAHFNPKPKGRGKGAKLDGKVAEKRGGKGGGDWPSMGELKRWMMQVDELVIENEQQPDQDEDSDGDYMNIDYADMPTIPAEPSSEHSSTPLIASNVNYLADYQQMLNASYAAPMMDLQTPKMHVDMGMQPSLHHALAMQNQGIDASAMFFDVPNGMLMADDMNNDLSFPSLSPSFPVDVEQQQQQQQWSFR